MAVLLTLVCAISAEARTVRADIAIAPTGTCMIRSGGGIGCFGDAVPANFTDGYIWIRRSGRPRISESGGTLAPTTGRPRRLGRGDRWKKRGVTCMVRNGLKCWNEQHGFTLTRRSYRLW
jgi:hypothetical protein